MNNNEEIWVDRDGRQVGTIETVIEEIYEYILWNLDKFKQQEKVSYDDCCQNNSYEQLKIDIEADNINKIDIARKFGYVPFNEFYNKKTCLTNEEISE